MALITSVQQAMCSTDHLSPAAVQARQRTSSSASRRPGSGLTAGASERELQLEAAAMRAREGVLPSGQGSHAMLPLQAAEPCLAGDWCAEMSGLSPVRE